MVTIFATTDKRNSIQQAIEKVARLDELVSVLPIEELGATPQQANLIVDSHTLRIPLTWDNSLPPYMLPTEMEWEEEVLMGLIFHLLENDQQSWEYLNGKPLYKEIETQNKFKYGIPLSEAIPYSSDYRNTHNQAVLMHYGLAPCTGAEQVIQQYQQAISLAPSGEEAAFTLRELAILQLDLGLLAQAAKTLSQAYEAAISDEALHAIRLHQVKVLIQQLGVPLDKVRLEALKQILWESLTYYEAQEKPVQVGLLLLDATQVASLSGSYAEALGYIQRAHSIFEEASMEELAAQAMLQKGLLLGTWAQNGNPQFFKPAIESYQKALYVYSKESQPAVFADIQHKLGVLYAEMPDEHKKRGIWAGVSAASFQEALSFYGKEAYPYEYASICNNFANAYLKFPPAIHSDNYVKALHYYQEALEIRTDRYPYERAITLLNYLEASWNVGNDPSSFNQARFDDMIQKAEEVIRLVEDPDMVESAHQHIHNLKQLKGVIEKEKANA